MRFKQSLTTIILFISVGLSHGEENVGIQLEFKNPFSDIKDKFSRLKKPMKSCHMSEPVGGFNHNKRKVNLCTEEQLNVVREYMGTFEGTYSGMSNGKVKIEISDGGVIRGHGETDGSRYKLSGRAWFISTPLDDRLELWVRSSDVKNRNRISFKGKIEKDGLLNTDCLGAGKKGNRSKGTLSLRKTAPYKKSKVVARKKEPKKSSYTVPKPTARNSKKDNDPLFEAARKGDNNKVWKLVNKGYDITAVDESGATPFLVALRHGHMQTAQTLMAFGSDKNHKDNEGKTPLHYSAIYGVDMIAGVLVMGGVDTSIKDKSGKTARDWANEKGNKSVIKMLDALANPRAHPMFQR